MSVVWAAIVGPLTSVLILKEMGATSSQIGIFTALGACISMVMQPVWGYISDKTGSPRKVLCTCLGISTVFFGCVLLTRDIYVAAGLFLVEAMFRCCVLSLLDSHTLSEINTMPGMQYSYIRMGASIFYGALSFGYSGVINRWGVYSVIPISLAIALGAVLWGLFVAKGQWEAQKHPKGDTHHKKHHLKKEVASLLKDRRYILFVLFVAIWAFGTLPLYTFIIDYVAAVGGGPGDVPFIHALRCVVEIPAFIVAGTVGKRMDAKKLMMMGMGFYFAHMAGLFLAGTFFWLSLAHFLAGPAFIFGLAGRMRYINEITPEPVRSTSITVMGAC